MPATVANQQLQLLASELSVSRYFGCRMILVLGCIRAGKLLCASKPATVANQQLQLLASELSVSRYFGCRMILVLGCIRAGKLLCASKVIKEHEHE
ncbi:hypothetical protein QVD17_34815 [Tagetes erecta]|uniref:Uncharacterized protein n=1 Tax=Tagetes erecta TaxID=13708 RepID=A0AAD8JYW3_TARER|nr:hypothetical protein QVD17_34815 [Tagetes erecta]